ncbi:MULTISPECIES: YfhH family protein [Sporosarcina]|uniref:YfhH family protein n=1 Tax=Sporosarcina TaxID=1569 RepID=UPI000590DEA5|nr:MULTISPECIES: YfhH family protein [Sporosarcina]WJY27656.1 YfhH family protein [Sporosarcina sp. 0.2-SM1T-5]
MENEKSYSQMTEHELRAEIARLMEKARKAEQLGILNEFAVYQRKALMAQSFLIDPASIIPGEIYKIQGDEGNFFKVDYLKGRFAWGYRLGSELAEEALPLAMLKSVKSGK